MSGWEIVRHQVAIAGRVTDARSGAAIGGAVVTISAGPVAFTRWLALQAVQHRARWASMVERPDQTRTAADGHFHFLDLPDGPYTLGAALPGTGSRYGAAQAPAAVAHDAQGDVRMAAADLALPPTAIEGQVTEQGTGTPVAMAEVRVKGSGERTFSDGQGRYLLAGLEAGTRTAVVSARGYQPASRMVALNQPGVVLILNVALAK